MMEARSADLVAVCSGQAEVEAAIDASSGTRVDGQALAGARWLERRRRTVLQLHRAEPTGVVAIVAPTSRPCSGSSRASRRRLQAATPWSWSPPRRTRSRRSSLPRRSRPPIFRAARSTSSRAARRARARPRSTHGRERDRRHGCRGGGRRARGPRGRQRQAVVHAGSDQSPWEISAFLELKTVWHPIGT